MGLSMVAGRGFTEQDTIGKPWRVDDQQAACRVALAGTRVRSAAPPCCGEGKASCKGEVVGVVSDMRERGLESGPTLAVYIPAYGALGGTTLQLVMHTRGAPESAGPALRSIVTSVDPTLPVSGIRTLEEVVTASVATRRLTMLLLVTFAGLAALLALAGVYGVLAYSVARRTSEIGVRLALGARRAGLLRRVIAQGMRPVIAGIDHWPDRDVLALAPDDDASCLGSSPAIRSPTPPWWARCWWPRSSRATFPRARSCAWILSWRCGLSRAGRGSGGSTSGFLDSGSTARVCRLGRRQREPSRERVR